jgi:hypothetical protein
MTLGRFLCVAMIWLGAGAAAAQPAGDSRAVTDDALAALAASIVQACPTTADISSAAERDACAENLSKITLLSEATLEGSLRWGGVSQGDFNPAHNSLTLLNSLVWRMLYLSLFAFTGEHSIDILPDESRLMRLGVKLRPLAASEYPYPFWHSAAKWRSYQQASQIALLFKGGVLLAAYRNSQIDAQAPLTDRTWAGYWTTDDAGHVQPRTSLYGYLLSPANPDLANLEHAYKALATEARRYSCAACHNPANPAGMNPLVIFNLPNQALSARHEIVFQLSHNQLPPGRGISDDKAREEMLRLTQAVETIGDRALKYEEAARN